MHVDMQRHVLVPTRSSIIDGEVLRVDLLALAPTTRSRRRRSGGSLGFMENLVENCDTGAGTA
jgi:hypothetical protein